jgi:hypothetical protein
MDLIEEARGHRFKPTPWRDRIDRAWRYWRAYLYPQWYDLRCDKCHMKLRARSGMHMTEAVGRHNREFHGWK